MPRLTPISRHDLIQRLVILGFEGPYAGGRHQFMVRGDRRLILPNPHRKDIGTDLLARLLRQAGISHEEWQALS
jgi:predicted RNA binding protein YcfA (HicA-like mRNA interferase family)